MAEQLQVLVLEDRPADAELMIHELRRSGFDPQWERVDAEADYLAALDRAPDVVLADYSLPQWDATRALELLQARGTDLPFIVVTGSLGEEAAVECMKRGAADYLLKDRLSRLGQAVRRALEQRAAREERRRAAQRADAEEAERVRQQVAREEAERSQRRYAFLSEASRLLASSLDYEATLQQVARLAVPVLADLCFVDLVGEDDWIERLAVACGDAAWEQWARQMLRRYPPDLSADHGVPRVLRNGEPVLVPDVRGPIGDHCPLLAAGGTPGQMTALDRLRPRSLMIVPLVARGRALGALTFIRAESGASQTGSDLALARELADRAAMAVDNARLYAQAQNAIAVRDHFLATAAHDLNTPLTAIKGLAQIARRAAMRSPGAANERVVPALEQIDRTTAKMEAMIRDLLDVARLELGHDLELDRQPADLVGIARRAAAEHGATSGRHRITLDAAEASVHGRWDRARIERVVDNLVGNAVKYSPSGGEIALVVRQERDDGHWAVLEVRDNGLGIPEDELPRVFERFYRGTNVQELIPGTGLGLAGVRRVVEQHGGTISVNSRVGSGSTFTVRLPAGPPGGSSGVAAEATQAAGEDGRVDAIPPASSALQSGPGGRGRVLVVEDDEPIRSIIAEALTEERYDVRAAANGRDALGILEGWRPDAIILDLMMPVMDGYSFRAEQRQRAELRDIPVIIVSASRHLTPPPEALHPAAIVPKPFDAAELVATLGRVVAARRV